MHASAYITGTRITDSPRPPTPQFPDRIQQLKPVTQLYVSVDAATPESLKAVDRPLFKDYWERFTGSLEALNGRRQRTVYRWAQPGGEAGWVPCCADSAM